MKNKAVTYPSESNAPAHRAGALLPLTRLEIEDVVKAHRTPCVACGKTPLVGGLRLLVIVGSARNQKRYVYCAEDGAKLLDYYARRMGAAREWLRPTPVPVSPTTTAYFREAVERITHPFLAVLRKLEKDKRAAAKARKEANALANAPVAETRRNEALSVVTHWKKRVEVNRQALEKAREVEVARRDQATRDGYGRDIYDDFTKRKD